MNKFFLAVIATFVISANAFRIRHDGATAAGDHPEHEEGEERPPQDNQGSTEGKQGSTGGKQGSTGGNQGSTGGNQGSTGGQQKPPRPSKLQLVQGTTQQKPAGGSTQQQKPAGGSNTQGQQPSGGSQQAKPSGGSQQTKPSGDNQQTKPAGDNQQTKPSGDNQQQKPAEDHPELDFDDLTKEEIEKFCAHVAEMRAAHPFEDVAVAVRFQEVDEEHPPHIPREVIQALCGAPDHE